MGIISQTEEDQLRKKTAQPPQPAQADLPSAPSAAAPALPDWNAQYRSAMDRLQQVKQQLPDYKPSYDQSLQELFDRIMGYEPFRYSPREDQLYQSYKQQYAAQGQRAMEDSMGQAAALTGGYGSTYGQAVGQQQYGAYLQKLNDRMPELYGLAYQQYQGELGALQDQYALTDRLAKEEYGRYQDRMEQYYQELDYWQSAADTAYDRQLEADRIAYDRRQDDYAKQQDAYQRLVDLMTNLGYIPSKEEQNAAGMSDSQMQAYRNYYLGAQSAGGGSGGGGRGKKPQTQGTPNSYQELDRYLQSLASGGATAQTMAGVIKKALTDQIINTHQRNVLTKKYPQNAID